ncbi:MAG: ABC transporter ATP-binding protein [Saccharospirillaceae bacterium]|nr:ABC transporter ATP-binding protein [Pseudomonadales bacterium]NRB80337.1 ABC transporter ATP-binding protein [Saccharospirillaceae bacterium]
MPESQQPKIVIKISQLKKSFKKIIAVDGVSFNVRKGQCFGLLGPNGAGKTTCIEILEGISKADSGVVDFPLLQNKKKLNEYIGMTFQHTALPDFIKVKETLALFSDLYPHTIDIQNIIESCQLSDILERNVKKLSGGQRQRLLLALALVNDPEVIFLDEPTTGLDPHARRDFWTLLESIKQLGKTIILTTHYMDEAHQLCDEIAIMNQGKIIEQGAPITLLRKHFKQSTLNIPLDDVEDRVTTLTKQGWKVFKNHVELKTEHLPQAISFLVAHNINITHINIQQPTLDDLFIKLTGSSLDV